MCSTPLRNFSNCLPSRGRLDSGQPGERHRGDGRGHFCRGPNPSLPPAPAPGCDARAGAFVSRSGVRQRASAHQLAPRRSQPGKDSGTPRPRWGRCGFPDRADLGKHRRPRVSPRSHVRSRGRLLEWELSVSWRKLHVFIDEDRRSVERETVWEWFQCSPSK